MQIIGLDSTDGGRLGRLEADMREMKAWRTTTERQLERLDRIVWKFSVAATMAGMATAVAVKVVEWIFKH